MRSLPLFLSTLEKIRTSDLNVRNVALYPTELRELIKAKIVCVLYPIL